MAKIGQVFLLAILLAAASCQDEGEVIQDSPLVVTPLGSIRGVKGTTEAGTKFLKFTKVPFAEPPLGYLRLRKPVKKQPWSEELDGTQPTPACPQIDLLTNSSKGQEDCLFLNIFTPITNVEDIGQADLKPVMLWIHGGGFTGGDATTLTNPEFLLDEDVVFVAIQYRLGVLGFLAEENSADLPGNLGLRDQQEAMRWVQGNIASFGGDPAKVTIFGESAGAVSVHLHILSPPAKGLFRAGILQSGTALLSYEKFISKATEKQGRKVLEALGCVDSEEKLFCLQSPDVEAFIDPELGVSLAPVQDHTSSDPVLPYNPLHQMLTGHFHRVPILNGVTLNDGSVTWVLKDALKENFNSNGQRSLSLTGLAPELDQVSTSERLLTSFYLGRRWSGSLEDNAEAITDLNTDAAFASPAHQVSKQHSKVAPAYSYLLASRCNDLSIGVFFNSPSAEEPGFVSHGDDIPCIFKPDGIILGKQNEEQAATSQAMVKAWTNFAKHHKPATSASWTSGGQPMIFQPESSILTRNQEKEQPFHGLADRMQLWEDLYWKKKEEQLPMLIRENTLQALSTWNFQPEGYKNQEGHASFKFLKS